MMRHNDQAKANLIFVAQAHYQTANWLQLVGAWVFGRHQIIRHLGRIARVSFWRGRPYLLSFRDRE